MEMMVGSVRMTFQKKSGGPNTVTFVLDGYVISWGRDYTKKCVIIIS